MRLQASARACDNGRVGEAVDLGHAVRSTAEGGGRGMVTMRNAIRFRRRGRIVELTGFHPRATLLDYLRLVERQRRHQGGLRGGRLRRLHGGARAREGRPPRL